jgi:hypothetical protein
MGRNLLRCAGDDDLPTAIATLRPQVNNVVGTLDHVEVMLDDDNGVSRRYQPIEHVEQLANIVEMKPRGRLVEHIERPPRRPFGQLTAEFYPLRFPVRQGRRGEPGREYLKRGNSCPRQKHR